MPLEIERKYLLASDAWRREVCRRQPMAQGYLVGVGGKASIRVRVAIYGDFGMDWVPLQRVMPVMLRYCRPCCPNSKTA